MFYLNVNTDLKGAILILPSVSVGNVGQLASDLIIKTLKMTRIGYVDHHSIIPFIGNDPYSNTNELCLSCEIYWDKTCKLVVLQIRSGFGNGKGDFINKLCDWMNTVEISQVVMLTGSHSHERKDKQLIGEPFRYIFCPMMCKKEIEDAEQRGWIKYEQNIPVPDVSLNIPGSGQTVSVLRQCMEHKIQSAVLIEFCSDGNNVPDAVRLCNYLDSWLKIRKKCNIEESSWCFPPSWVYLFGPPPPKDMFG